MKKYFLMKSSLEFFKLIGKKLKKRNASEPKIIRYAFLKLFYEQELIFEKLLLNRWSI